MPETMSTTPVNAAGATPAPRIRAVISDIDGTLLRPDKALSPATVEAVRALREAGIPFGLASARPPVGLKKYIAALNINGPCAAFNGGNIIAPDLRVLAALPLPEADAREALAHLAAAHIDAWAFSAGHWYILRPDGDYVDHEEKTIDSPPVCIPAFEAPHINLAAIDKIVGPSKRFDDLADIDRDMQQRFAGRLTVGLSQKYYLDITHRDADKGHAIRAIAKQLALPVSEIAVLGDMANDVPMFRVAGWSFAMGQASDEVKSAARSVTLSNAEDGVAAAIREQILPQVRAQSSP